MFLMVSTAFAQVKVSGTVTDGKGTLPGANIVLKGTKQAVSTDFDGKFSINAPTNSGELIVSFIGYQAKTVKFNGGANLGTIVLMADDNQLDEIVVKSSVIDVAKDRKTPVAVSTIRAAEIQEKLGNQEFPEILANTPSVYASKSGGGVGDSRVTIRGFDQKNIAVMINGVPVNDMENSSVYWSNWAGLSDVTSNMQVQRGLGSSKLAISSVGGTINVVTRTSEMKEGGTASAGFGNNNYLKTNFSYNTGILKNGLSASILLNQTHEDGYVNGTQFQGGNYFIALGYKPNEKHDFQFTFTGAPQYHDQRNTTPTIAQFLQYGNGSEPNRKLNLDAGTLNGEAYNFRTNYYHKPIASINWDYKISEKMKLSTVFYGSWGRGGGSAASGGARGRTYTDATFRNADGSLNVDKIYGWNTGTVGISQTNTSVSPNVTNTLTRTLTNGEYINSNGTGSFSDRSTGISKIASTNSHNWYGTVVNLNTKLTKEFTLDFGVDMRTYKGIHFQTVNDNLGANGYKDVLSATNGDINAAQPNIITGTYAVRPNLNPFWNTDYQQKVNYWNDSKVNWIGAFSQLEYAKDNLTAFVQGAVSEQGFKRIDYFRFTTASGNQETSYKNILGGNVKAGANYNIDEHHNVFVNSGYYSKQPFMNAVYPNNRNFVNDNLTNEKIFGLELGYGFRSSKFNANLNLYRTTWNDRFQTVADKSTLLLSTTLENPDGYFSFSGLNETHQGIELDFNARPIDRLVVNGMFSIGNWHYNGNATSTRYTVTNELFGTGSKVLYLDGVKVGNAAQTTAAIGASYEVVTRLKIDANYRYTDKLYANITPTNFDSPTNKGALVLPSFGLVDAGFSYKMLVGKEKSDNISFRLNVNNLLDKVYISEANSNIFADDIKSGTTTYAQAGALYQGVATANQVYFGFGRTWNFGIAYNFK